MSVQAIQKERIRKMFIYNKKVAAILLLATFTTIMIAFPTSIFAASTPQAAAGEKTTITQEFTYKEGEKPNIKQEISQFGQVFTLVSVSDPKTNKSLPKSRSHTYQVSSSYTPEQLSQAPKNVTLTPVYGTGKRQVDREETIKNLPDNDVDRLALKKAYTDTDGHGPGTEAKGELVLAEVRFEPAGWDEDGLPNNYTAYVFYRGEETYTKLLYYEAVTTYTDTVTEDGDATYTVVATYEGDAPEEDEPEDSTADYTEDDDYVAAAADEGAGGGAGPDGGESVAETETAAEAAGKTASGFPFTLGELSTLGTAAIATMAAAIIALLFLGIYNRRRVRESAQAS